MTNKCAACGTNLDPGDTFCQGCGAPITSTSAQKSGPDKTVSILGRIEQAVYFRIARTFAWVLAVVALAGFFYSLGSAVQSAGELAGTKRSVSVGEVQSSIANARAGRGNQFLRDEVEVTDPRQIGEYETVLAELVNLIPLERRPTGGDDALRSNFRMLFSPLGKNIEERISAAKEAKGVLQGFSANEREDALMHYARVKREKDQIADMQKAKATEKFTYLAGAIVSTAILITLVSMILVLLTIERNTRAAK